MSRSQNGWPVVTKADCDTADLIPGVRVPNGVLKGDVATVFRWLAQQYNARVERLIYGTCWGWFVKTIEGSTSISNHASATAVDFNADRHPMGTAASNTMSSAQIKACHAIIAEAGGVLRWGGDYTGRPDPMHWEIHTTAAGVKAFADKIRGDDMPTAVEIAEALLDAPIGDTAWPNRTVRQVLRDLAAERDGLVGGGAAEGHTPHTIPASSPLGKLLATAEETS